MQYIQIDINVNREGIEPVVSALMEVGITDVVIEDPADIDDLLNKENDYEWDYIDDSVLELKNQEPKVTVYLEDDEEGRAKAENARTAVDNLKNMAAAGLFGEGVDLGPLTVEIKTDDDSEWKDKWKEYFKPAKISKTIVVKPTWEEYTAKDGEKVLEIDPGMAFGTGTHETTSLCVRLMEDYMKPGDKVLDVGCGSGILAIVGAMLGAGEVLGVEIDPVAVEIAQENILLNHVEKVARAQYGDLTKGIDFKADVVVANLMADLVMLLSKDVAAHMLPGAKYISSGILAEKAPVVVDCMRALDFKILEVKQDGMWCAIVAEK
ncbi:MAG: 50S ribosomal protein L11 methyltransferase [Firmicutes bacterium]|nr:50S ribosomal protein L11 methyltransferase [Bacillota bacterium]